jgi:23S rRNA (guanine745-N1)-methyltransferase
LDRGYYQPLRDELVRLVWETLRPASAGTGAGTESHPAAATLLDICCGEGYYTAGLGAVPGVAAYGFDLSKEMVRLAAKRGHATYFVANMKDVPVQSAAFDLATCLFAPFDEREVARVLKPGGTLFVVVPGARHLWGLKQTVYDTPYLNDEALPACTQLRLEGTSRVEAQVTLATPQDIEAVFQMTPYYFRTRPADRAKLAGVQTLETPLEFVIARYRR